MLTAILIFQIVILIGLMETFGQIQRLRWTLRKILREDEAKNDSQ